MTEDIIFEDLSYEGQGGEAGHCYLAQVFTSSGMSLAEIEPTLNPIYATAYARLFAASPFMLEALKHAKQNMPHPDQMIDDAIALATA